MSYKISRRGRLLFVVIPPRLAGGVDPDYRGTGKVYIDDLNYVVEGLSYLVLEPADAGGATATVHVRLTPAAREKLGGLRLSTDDYRDAGEPIIIDTGKCFRVEGVRDSPRTLCYTRGPVMDVAGDCEDGEYLTITLVGGPGAFLTYKVYGDAEPIVQPFTRNAAVTFHAARPPAVATLAGCNGRTTIAVYRDERVRVKVVPRQYVRDIIELVVGKNEGH